MPSEQKAYWPSLGSTKDLNFTLYGGTAIALYLGHREFIDFVFFTHKPFKYDNMHKELLHKFSFLLMAELTQATKNTLTYLTDTKVQFSFFGGIDFGRIGNPVQTQDGIANIASLDDLLALKLSVIMQRIELKDYIDISASLQNGMSLEKGLNDASALYSGQFFPLEAVKALTYFKNEELELLTEQDKKTLVHAACNVDVSKLLPSQIISHNLQVEE